MIVLMKALKRRALKSIVYFLYFCLHYKMYRPICNSPQILHKTVSHPNFVILFQTFSGYLGLLEDASGKGGGMLLRRNIATYGERSLAQPR